MKALVLPVLILTLLPLAAASQDADRVEAMRAAYAEWLERNQTTGTGALAFQGADTYAIGDATAPIELASVSKSITALCAAALRDSGDLDMSVSVRDVLGRGPDVSVASLVTHTSGITEDVTQKLMPEWLDTDDQRGFDVLEAMSAPSGVSGQYVYNNVNYALLGLVIETSVPDSYEDTCKRLVLDPVGVTGMPSPRAGGFLSWGGWTMSPLDYARLHAHWYGQGTATGRNPFDYPHVQLFENGPYYGLGTMFRPNHTGDGTFNFWHFGALCFPGRMSVGSYAVTFGGKWTAIMGYDACVDFDTMLALDTQIGRAAYGAVE
ncbi:MAG: serine hydrolase [Tateyamaria sp.]|jgi:CubicO group peptidase (beta-lactamase class C family)|uniref:serine hydrolase domain-containing protein n=1 Tax=Tateyamaria sp. TaxID=1929288 RepID=UPI0032DDB01A